MLFTALPPCRQCVENMPRGGPREEGWLERSALVTHAHFQDCGCANVSDAQREHQKHYRQTVFLSITTALWAIMEILGLNSVSGVYITARGGYLPLH